MYCLNLLPYITHTNTEPKDNYNKLRLALKEKLCGDEREDLKEKKTLLLTYLAHFGTLGILCAELEHEIVSDLCLCTYLHESDYDITKVLRYIFNSLSQALGYDDVLSHTKNADHDQLNRGDSSHLLVQERKSIGLAKANLLQEHLSFVLLEWLSPESIHLQPLAGFPWYFLPPIVSNPSEFPDALPTRPEYLGSFNEFCVQYQNIIIPALVLSITYDEIIQKDREQELDELAHNLGTSIDELLRKHHSRVMAL